MASTIKLTAVPRGVRIYCRECKRGRCGKCVKIVKDTHRSYACNCKHLVSKREDFVSNEIALVGRLNSLFQF